jgi:hypothetical protein
MASSSGTLVSSGNTDGDDWIDKFGGLVMKAGNSWIDHEFASDTNNIKDQNDLVNKNNSSKNTMGYNTGINPSMLIYGGLFLVVAVVVAKKVL